MKIEEYGLLMGELAMIPLRNVLASDKKILAILEGKSWDEACKIQIEAMKKK